MQCVVGRIQRSLESRDDENFVHCTTTVVRKRGGRAKWRHAVEWDAWRDTDMVLACVCGGPFRTLRCAHERACVHL